MIRIVWTKYCAGVSFFDAVLPYSCILASGRGDGGDIGFIAECW